MAQCRREVGRANPEELLRYLKDEDVKDLKKVFRAMDSTIEIAGKSDEERRTSITRCGAHPPRTTVE